MVIKSNAFDLILVVVTNLSEVRNAWVDTIAKRAIETNPGDLPVTLARRQSLSGGEPIHLYS